MKIWNINTKRAKAVQKASDTRRDEERSETVLEVRRTSPAGANDVDGVLSTAFPDL